MKTPELDKLNACWEEVCIIRDFLDSCGYILGEYLDEHEWALLPSLKSTDRIITDYFELDMEAVDRERRMLIASLHDEADPSELN